MKELSNPDIFLEVPFLLNEGEEVGRWFWWLSDIEYTKDSDHFVSYYVDGEGDTDTIWFSGGFVRMLYWHLSYSRARKIRDAERYYFLEEPNYHIPEDCGSIGTCEACAYYTSAYGVIPDHIFDFHDKNFDAVVLIIRDEDSMHAINEYWSADVIERLYYEIQLKEEISDARIKS